MTFEQLKREADKQGYDLVKRKTAPKLVHCICGFNKHTTWQVKDRCVFECILCGRRVEGKNLYDTTIKWNRQMGCNYYE